MNKKTLIIISIILVIIIPLIFISIIHFSKEKDSNIIDENKIHFSENTNLQESNIIDNIVATDIETEDKTDTVETTKDEIKETKDKIENNKDTKENTNLVTNDNKNEDTKDEIVKENKQNITNEKTENKTETVKKTEDKNVIDNTKIDKEEQKTTTAATEQTKTNVEEKKEEAKKIDLSKYDYYEESLNGTYKAFIKDSQDMAVLRSLIDECITEFGYTDVKVEQDKTLPKSGTSYFTTNKNNVENLVYDTEGFTIYYYSVKEYHISADGTATFFQTRSYIKVR